MPYAAPSPPSHRRGGDPQYPHHCGAAVQHLPRPSRVPTARTTTHCWINPNSAPDPRERTPGPTRSVARPLVAPRRLEIPLRTPVNNSQSPVNPFTPRYSPRKFSPNSQFHPEGKKSRPSCRKRVRVRPASSNRSSVFRPEAFVVPSATSKSAACPPHICRHAHFSDLLHAAGSAKASTVHARPAGTEAPDPADARVAVVHTSDTSPKASPQHVFVHCPVRIVTPVPVWRSSWAASDATSSGKPRTLAVTTLCTPIGGRYIQEKDGLG